MENSLRFDDLVRTERYFTATLLLLLLFHNNPSGELEGVRRFVELVDEKATTEYDKEGKQDPKRPPEYNNFKDVEVITEFHIARDLKFAGPKLEVNDEPSEEGKAKLAARNVLVRRFSQIDGYRCLSLIRALAVVNCQSALA
jgi:hypothetical protein